jgi:YD repeat-containing protein
MISRTRCAFVLGLSAASFAATPALAYDRVQPPELAVGQRANLAGSLATTAYSASDVSRGGFTLPAPFASPTDRGPLLAPVFPSYSPDNGLSAWGMGFGANLELTRWRVSGSLQYDFSKGDEMTSPFGRLTLGTDGSWYPVGLDKPVRVVAGAGDTFVAYHPDGSVWTFGGAARVAGASGTYAWQLTQIKDAVGHVTTLTWTPNASGKPFLAQVSYGGRATPQYLITFAYESVTMTDAAGNVLPKFVDYRSGAPLALDQRVKTVTVLARNAQTGVFAERWHYDLSYEEESIGAAFYLTEIDQTFASGEAAPPVRYTYALKGATFASTTLAEVPELTQLFATLGVTEDILQPTRAAVIDADGDGNSDLELDDASRTLVSQLGSGTPQDPLRFATTPLPAPTAPACSADGQTGCVFDGCLPTVTDDAIAPPRMLSQLNPTDTSVAVVHFLYDSDADQTAISVCSRDGVRTSEQGVSSQWSESDLVRFVDLNADHMPDLVRVSFGRYDVLPNTTLVAGAEAEFAWGGMTSGMLGDSQGNPFTPDAVWVSDMSGDGIPDLVGLYGDAIEVWHGLGNFQFVTSAQELRFVDRQGQPFTGLAGYKLVPADLNKDGLQDYFVTNIDSSTSRFIKYFTNVGGGYVESPVAALDGISFTASAPIIATLDGSGNMAVTVTDTGKAYSVALDGPETGLMATADDGRGTVLSFGYARGPASPGIRHRSVLLASLGVQASGYDAIAYDYRYDQPTVHSIGHFLVGYGQVTRQEGDLPSAPLGESVMTFLNADAYSGVLATGATLDVRLPGVAKIESRTYTDEAFEGIAYKRLASVASGWANADGSSPAVDTTTYDAYESDFCASQTTMVSSSHGTLVTKTDRANPAGLVNALHCLEAHITHAGTHADGTLDFHDETTILRNAAGRVTQIASLGASGALVQQSITYDADIDPIAIATPGTGTTTIAYDPATKLSSRVLTPDGVATSIAARDPVTDGVEDVRTDRGGASWNAFARYDGQERLAAKWSDVDGSSAQAPAESLAYTYASTDHPATIGVQSLVEPATATFRSVTELYTAAQEKIGTAQLHDVGWVLDGFVARSRARGVEDRFEIANEPAATPMATIDYATLLQGAPAEIGAVTHSTLGTDVATTERLHTDVTRATSTTLAVAGGGLARTTLVNGTNGTTTSLDPSGKLVLAYVDEAQTRYGYAYDALGRLRVVTLPDGTHHTVTYDEYGRESAIVRDGITRITNAYVAVSGGTTDLLATRTFASAPSDGSAPVPMRRVAWTYDAAGRKLVEAHSDLVSGAAKSFTFFYDGASPAAATTPGALGLLTAVAGQGYTKGFVYRADGKVLHREVDILGFREISTDFTYRPDGSTSDEVVTVADASGNVLETSAHHEEVDAFGRPTTTSINGNALASTTYDGFGRPGAATFATGDAVSFAYDPLTRSMVGFDQTRAKAGGWPGVSSTRVKKNDRGFTGQETLGIGPAAVSRQYTYSPAGFLTLATDGVPQ